LLPVHFRIDGTEKVVEGGSSSWVPGAIGDDVELDEIEAGRVPGVLGGQPCLWVAAIAEQQVRVADRAARILARLAVDEHTLDVAPRRPAQERG